MIVDPQSKGRIEIIARCPKCGEDFTRNFTPQNKQGWREVEEAARDHEKTCPQCSYAFAAIIAKFVGTGIFPDWIYE